ncbi:MAG: glycosyl hydrolase family 28-related protein, partial [Thermoguttaceae bacterium]
MSVWPIKITIVGLPRKGFGLHDEGKNPVNDHPRRMEVKKHAPGMFVLLALQSMTWLLYPASSYSQAAGRHSAGDEFVGPFSSWANVKDYGAVGDGRTDDTAAIQKAMEAVRSKDSASRVLYFPAGAYRITSTLKLDRISHSEPLGMSITGEAPEKTTILWDGPAGQTMFHYNAWYASLSRFTLDGAGKAKVALQHGIAFTTANEISDIVFKDVQVGIEAGMRDGIAETAVLRCRFYRCSKVAISIQNFNSLD